jgi:hypothetical protein
LPVRRFPDGGQGGQQGGGGGFAAAPEHGAKVHQALVQEVVGQVPPLVGERVDLSGLALELAQERTAAVEHSPAAMEQGVKTFIGPARRPAGGALVFLGRGNHTW